MTENETHSSDASEAVAASLRRYIASHSRLENQTGSQSKGQPPLQSNDKNRPPALNWPTIITASLGSQPTTLNSGERHQDFASVELYIPENLSWFLGHFPDQPVLPGVVQIHWAGQIGMHLFGISTPFGRMTRLKFKSPVLPDCPLNLELTFKPIKQLLTFRYSTGSVECSSGNLTYTPLKTEPVQLDATDNHPSN